MQSVILLLGCLPLLLCLLYSGSLNYSVLTSASYSISSVSSVAGTGETVLTSHHIRAGGTLMAVVLTQSTLI